MNEVIGTHTFISLPFVTRVTRYGSSFVIIIASLFDPPLCTQSRSSTRQVVPLKEEADDRLLLYLAIACAPRPPSRRTRARADAIFHPPVPPVPRVSILLRARTLVSRGLRRGGSLRGSRFPRRGLLSELLGTSIPVSRGACRARERSRRSRA